MFIFSEFLLLASINFSALLSPGPNFALLVRNTLVLPRSSALAMAAGIALAGFIHEVLIILGLGILICDSPMIVNVFKILGGLYLGYLGLESLGLKQFLGIQSKQKAPSPLEPSIPKIKNSWLLAMRQGFLVNVLNPVSLLFFLGIFSSCVSPLTPIEVRFVYAILLSLMDLCWHSLTVLCFSHPRLQKFFSKSKPGIEKLTGLILIVFAFVLISQ